MVAAQKRARELALASSCDAKAKASQQQHDMWMHVFDFLPGGHYLLLCSVSTAWRAFHASSMQRRKQASQYQKATVVQAVLASLPLRQWALANGCNKTKLLWHLVKCGELEVVQDMYADGTGWGDDARSSVPICKAAAARGDLEMLQWARANRFFWDKGVTAAAAGGGHLQVLQWLRANQCPSDFTTCALAANGGHLEVLEWAHDAGCGWFENMCSSAAAGGNLHVLQYARGHGCPWAIYTSYNAARHGHLQLLQWAHANGCPLHDDVAMLAAGGDHLHVLQWLVDIGHPCDHRACAMAARRGRIDTLQWLRARDFPWDGRVCTGAVIGGHLELLRWARANGCPWEEQERTFEFINWLDNNHSDPNRYVTCWPTMEWALANGCPCSDENRLRCAQLQRKAMQGAAAMVRYTMWQ
eukprot:TRINITY_DN462_c1_g4_i1.p1 TRINITY_DN462_c1_g4~~TRINITY_DN462_c1_g4_i1.p1  ORF type:complete len:457 (-),score=76.06 TRINITY_DN462_c1_g4_i1:174-1415(-)